MLNQPTIEKLQAMKLYGMAEAFREQIDTAGSSQLTFEERFGLLVDRQWTWKEGRALTRRLQLAKFKERDVVDSIQLSLSVLSTVIYDTQDQLSAELGDRVITLATEKAEELRAAIPLTSVRQAKNGRAAVTTWRGESGCINVLNAPEE